MKRLRIGIIGLGWVGTHRHLPTMRRNKKFEIVGVADRNAEKSAECAEKFGIPFYCTATSIADINWMDKVDAVDIATAPMTHFGLIRDALESRKHVITEKPFAMTVSEGEGLVELARQRALKLAIVHNFQFARSTQLLEKDLKAGRIGKIKSIIAVQLGNPRRRLPLWYEELPGGLFYDESPHLLYLVRKLSPGPLRLVGVDVAPSTVGLHTPASIDASYRAVSNNEEIPVSVSCRFEAPLSEWHVLVLGEQAAGLIDVFRDIYLRLPNDRSHGTLDVLRTSLYATSMHWASHFVNGPLHVTGRLLYGNGAVFDGFARSILSDERLKGIDATDALAVLRMQHEILAKAGLIGWQGFER